MVDGAYDNGASSNQEGGQSSKSAVEINVKTLDSRVHKFWISKDISIPALKEKIADATGIPVEQQRLIFRGKVLKDDYLLLDYHLEDGDTLHLVARQPAQSQPMTGPSSTDSSHANGDDSTSNTTRTAVGQVSVVGSVSIDDQGEGAVADIGRVIGAVLQSLGAGMSTHTSGANNTATASNQNSVAGEAERSQNGDGRPQLSNQAQPGVAQMSQLASVALPRNMVIPDSLTTILDFINRIASVLQNNGSQSSVPSNARDSPGSENLSSNVGGLPTPEMLALAIDRARQLLCGNVAASFSHIVERLHTGVSSSDATIRNQIQAEAVHMGSVMHHLGAMLLELGRTTTMLRMGSSNGESFVNAGPALYVSSTGPNPIFVQPVLPQASSLLSASSPLLSGLSGPFVGAELLRNINIHIRSGASAPPGASSSDALSNSGYGGHINVEQASQNRNGSRASDPRQGVPARTVVAAIPSHSTSETSSHSLGVLHPVNVRSQQSTAHPVPSPASNPTTSSGIQSNVSDNPHSSQESENLSEASVSRLVTEINERIANLLSEQRQNSSSHSIPSSDSGTQPFPTVSQVDATNSGYESKNVMVESQVPDLLLQDSEGKQIERVEQDFTYPTDSTRSLDLEASSSNSLIRADASCQSSDSFSTLSLKSAEKNSKQTVVSQGSCTSQPGANDRPIPLGLGVGGLQPKKRGKPTKPANGGVSNEVSSINLNKELIARGQQFLQSLVSGPPDISRANVNGSLAPTPSLISRIMDGKPLGGEGARGQIDVVDMTSRVLQSPALNNILDSLAEQTGVGPSALRSMMDQCTHSPAIRDTLSGIVQQVGGQAQDLGSMLLGSGDGQGAIDFSRMIQQMMPVVSQAVETISTRSTSGSVGGFEFHQSKDITGVTGQNDMPSERSFQIDLHEARQRIERRDSPGNIFHAVLEGVDHLHGEGSTYADLVQELRNNVELSDEYVEILCNHIRRRLQNQPPHDENS